MKKRIKIHGFLIFLAMVMIVIFPQYLLSGLRIFWLDLICVFAIVWGYFIRMSARGLKSELNPDGHTLVTAGPYSATRNPMYFGTFIIGLGISVMLFRWWIALIFFCIYLAIYIPLIRSEEGALSGRFGDAFNDYRRKVSGFFPKNLVFSLPVKPAWIKKELYSSLAPVAVLIIIIQSWADLKLRGSVVYADILLRLAVFFILIAAFTALALLGNKKYGLSGKS